ncbi:MAG TPA: ABC transporter ATP-binding protein [Candidatus Hydrogenedens sp.]|nr:ABC transporter ATP-binding protein [Candidatus Hydrogenedens sp.]HOL20977.1 ABC transporter ATP-binding protein [Candidatus Hydrogenedens sp.]HPP58313.1 ABC transporter ATP-binding protein [Candidatus Hydrogenedens sp.]
MSNPEPVIQTKDLTKVYDTGFRGEQVSALTQLNLEVFPSEIFGYLGPNGSGKTTTIKLLLGLIFPTSGEIKIMGKKDIYSPQVKKNIGYLPEGSYYPDFLRGEEILKFYGQLYGLTGKELNKRIDEVLEIVGMKHARRRMLKGYSKGMRQRIGLAQALISDPQILILDEPTTGLDPIARKEIRDILSRLRDAGKTLFISSHELLEVEMITNRVGILYNGILRVSGTLDELLISKERILEFANATDERIQEIKDRGGDVVDNLEDRIYLKVKDDQELYNTIELGKTVGLQLVSITPRRETLEELFVRVVNTAKLERSKNNEHVD